MPKTRNVTHTQWDAANAIHTTNSKENDNDSEKENGDRMTRARTRAAGRTVLGSISTRQTTTTTTAKKPTKKSGKDKAPPKGSKTKTDKLPLQDITRRFLPAPEPENRYYTGNDSLGAQEIISARPSIVSPIRQPLWNAAQPLPSQGPSRLNRFPSSLPPSSPPSRTSVARAEESVVSDLPVLPSSPNPLAPSIFTRHAEEEHVFDNAWNEFDCIPQSDANDKSDRTPRNSDPFGFFALERKLKEQRELEQEEEDLGLILVADTSSPRTVPRLSRSNSNLDNQDQEDALALSIASPVHFFSPPPTPHKDKTKGRKSCGSIEEHIFSPHSSSCPSSPSPSKPCTSSGKRKVIAIQFADQEDEDEGPAHSTPGVKRTKVDNSDRGAQLAGRQLRKRNVSAVDANRGKTKARAAKGEAKGGSKVSQKKSKPKKSNLKLVDESDADERWEKERQERLEYFRQLEEYEVETEDVYVI